jgi:hypothetical protein
MWPSVLLPPNTTIDATDQELRTLGFIPAFLQERTPHEVLVFMGMRLVEETEADLNWMGLHWCTKPGGFYIGQSWDDWLKISDGVWQNV